MRRKATHSRKIRNRQALKLMATTCNALSSERQRSLTEMLRSSLWAPVLTPEQFARVISEVTELRVPLGAFVCRRGEPVTAWTGVIEGLVKLGSASASGKLVTYTGVTAGGWFGEGSLLKTEPRKYDAVALRDSRIARMPRTTFSWLRRNSIPFNEFLLYQLNERLGQMIAMLEFDRIRGPDERVAQCVASLFNPQLYPDTQRTLRISQEEIGHLSGLSRQRVNHALHVLQEAGLLHVEHVGITVLDLTGLSSFSSRAEVRRERSLQVRDAAFARRALRDRLRSGRV
jgi:CRP/FNR family transcriptional regulator, cyclic AMP receptor protein